MLEKFPGRLWYGGIIAIHANWPTYPRGIGWQVALKALGAFPYDTIFYEIDDIDQCKLLINRLPDSVKDPYNSECYHAAAWHEDLLDLAQKGFISGVVPKTRYEFELVRFEEIKAQFGKDLKLDNDGNIMLSIFMDGRSTEQKLCKPDQDDSEHDIEDWCLIPDGIRLTQAGIEELTQISNKAPVTEEIITLTSELLNLGRFDTAVREATLLLETKIKEFHRRDDLYGQRLIDYHLAEVINGNDNFNSAAIKTYKSELRSIFKFIRNDFAHNFKILSEQQCQLLLSRISETLVEFNEVVEAYFSS